MKIGCHVIFKEKDYIVLWVYNNGTCEIKEQDLLGKVNLVSLSDLEVHKENISLC
ncbi:hypothetical protein ABEY55_08390 [Priestia aryabhattai]|uniref:hypothetical protein n=1 Tax=Priestia aryabhattai TaxID=412384 RepID=UPI003D2AF4F0